MATKRTKKTLGRAAVGVAIVVVVGLGLLGYNAAAGSSTSTNHYRTVTAAAGTVTQTIALSGVVHHVSQNSVSFPTSGMVTAVNVKAGDTVTAGQLLASIDTTPLQNTVLAANATYTAAVAQYETDQQTYASSSSTTSTTKAATTAAAAARQSTTGTGSSQAAAGPGAGGTGGTGGRSGTGGADPTAAVKAATDALAALETGVKSLSSALPLFVSDCIPLIPTTTAAPQATVTKTVTATATVTHTVTVAAAAASTGPTTATSTATGSSSATSSASSTAGASSSATSSPGSGVTADCQAAIDTLTSVQKTLPDQMTAANVTLAAAVKALDAQAAALQQEATTLAKQQQAAQAAATAAQAEAARKQASSLSSSNSALQAAAAAGLSRGGGNSPVTAATLITDQAAIQADSIALAQAKDQLSQATLTSPIAGRVASMPFVAGQQASATATAVIIGTGAIEVTVAVPLASRPLVATGEVAKVTSVVGGTTLQGTISRINLLPTTTSFSFSAAAAGAGAGGIGGGSGTTTTTYPTVITVPTGGDAIPEGSRVQTTITTKSVDAAVVVPASALTPLSSGSGTVQVITNGILSTKRVVTGAVGSTEIQIVSGVAVGETVVIADLTKPIAGASIGASRGQQFNRNANVGGEAGANPGASTNKGAVGNGGVRGVEPPAGGAQPS